MDALGTHILAEYKDCDVDIINDIQSVEVAMLEAAKLSGATVIGSSFHRFMPHGVSGVVMISESHLAIHTWPELKFAAVDIFTCGKDVDPQLAYEYLKMVFKSNNVISQTLNRGENV
jgi:S-adenosylmethionine decarboxylase proenzyme